MARSKLLVPTVTTEAEAAIAAQQAARLAKLATAQVAINAAVKSVHDAETVRNDARTAATQAEGAVYGKLETAYIALAAAAHDNDLTPEQCAECLAVAMKAFYGNNADQKIGPVAKLRSQLARAMHPKVRGSLSTIIAPWKAAFDTEDAKVKADSKTKKLVTDKFARRADAITQALTAAIGRPAKTHKKTGATLVPAVPSFVASTEADVATWVAAHPRVAKAPSTGSGPTTVDASLKGRDKARAQVDQLIVAVKAVAAEYPETKVFDAVLKALAACTGDKVIPSAAPAPAPAPAPVAAEPVAGVSNMVDDAMSDDTAALAEFKAFQAFLAMRNATK